MPGMAKPFLRKLPPRAQLLRLRANENPGSYARHPNIMANIRHLRGWEIPDRFATPESSYLNRRQFMKTIGIGAIAAAIPLGCARKADSEATVGPTTLPAARTAI